MRGTTAGTLLGKHGALAHSTPIRILSQAQARVYPVVGQWILLGKGKDGQAVPCVVSA